TWLSEHGLPALAGKVTGLVGGFQKLRNVRGPEWGRDPAGRLYSRMAVDIPAAGSKEQCEAVRAEITRGRDTNRAVPRTDDVVSGRRKSQVQPHVLVRDRRRRQLLVHHRSLQRGSERCWPR